MATGGPSPIAQAERSPPGGVRPQGRTRTRAGPAEAGRRNPTHRPSGSSVPSPSVVPGVAGAHPGHRHCTRSQSETDQIGHPHACGRIGVVRCVVQRMVSNTRRDARYGVEPVEKLSVRVVPCHQCPQPASHRAYIVRSRDDLARSPQWIVGHFGAIPRTSGNLEPEHWEVLLGDAPAMPTRHLLTSFEAKQLSCFLRQPVRVGGANRVSGTGRLWTTGRPSATKAAGSRAPPPGP